MDELASMQWTDLHGRAVRWPCDLRLMHRLGGAEHKGVVWQACDGQRCHIVKLRRYTTLRRKLAAACHRAPLDIEIRMTARAAAAGLNVPRFSACGLRRVTGLPVLKAAIMDAIPGAVSLWDIAREAARRNDDAELARAAAAVVSMTEAIRRAGFADADAGAHNMLVSRDAWQEQGADAAVTWIDLEAAYAAAPEDAAATAGVVGSHLAIWWWATQHEPTYRRMYAEMMARLPEPRGGWAGVADPIRRTAAGRVRKFLEDRRVTAGLPV